MTHRAPTFVLALLFAANGAAYAQPNSLFRDGFFRPESTAAPVVSSVAPVAATQAAGPSLFVGRIGASFFEPMKKKSPHVERLRTLIASVEAGKAGYDAVQLSARIRPPRRPTEMTVAEIYRWIEDTPGQHHAIGRYQFIPKTLRRLVKTLDVDIHARFSPDLQDKLADRLLAEAGFADFQDGTMSRDDFMDNLAKIWAGLPSSTGRSHYHGYAGNKAVISRTRFDDEMQEIFED